MQAHTNPTNTNSSTTIQVAPPQNIQIVEINYYCSEKGKFLLSALFLGKSNKLVFFDGERSKVFGFEACRFRAPKIYSNSDSSKGKSINAAIQSLLLKFGHSSNSPPQIFYF
jgi:hypothetical protein